MAHRALVEIPVAFIENEADHSFVECVGERELKQHFLMGGDRTLNETLNQALNLKAAKAAAGSPARMQELNRQIEVTEELRVHWRGGIVNPYPTARHIFCSTGNAQRTNAPYVLRCGLLNRCACVVINVYKL
jgi:hypothetical protein